MTFIIIKTDKGSFYQDYENKKSIILSTKEKIDFIDAYDSNWKFLAISFINKNLSREINSKNNKKIIKFHVEKI